MMLGDIHGSFKNLLKQMRRFDIRDTDIIQVGDFGIGFESVEREKIVFGVLNDFLKERNCTLRAFRGNHDNPSVFSEDPFLFSNIYLMPDYSVVEISGKKILMIGGAISIDRKDRQEYVKHWGVTYFEDEKFVFDKEKLDSLDLSNIDIICTHTSPKFTHPLEFNTLVYNYADRDAGLLRDLEIERQLVTDFYDYVKNKMPNLTHYFYGHFHTSWNSVIDGVEFRLLNINELFEFKK